MTDEEWEDDASEEDFWPDEDLEDLAQKEPDPRSDRIRGQIEAKLESGVMPDWMANIVRDELLRADEAESVCERRRVLEDLERSCLDALDGDIEVAACYLDDGDDLDVEDGEEEEKSDLQLFKDKAREQQRWYYQQSQKLDDRLRSGQISDIQYEFLCHELRKRFSSQSLKMGMASIGLSPDALSDLDWEARHLLIAGGQPEVHRKAQEIRDLLKRVPWHKREELLEQLRQKAGIDDNTYWELKTSILD